jgi:hypothetical protein
MVNLVIDTICWLVSGSVVEGHLTLPFPLLPPTHPPLPTPPHPSPPLDQPIILKSLSTIFTHLRENTILYKSGRAFYVSSVSVDWAKLKCNLCSNIAYNNNKQNSI